jgi:hypothetical protein
MSQRNPQATTSKILNRSRKIKKKINKILQSIRRPFIELTSVDISHYACKMGSFV